MRGHRRGVVGGWRDGISSFYGGNNMSKKMNAHKKKNDTKGERGVACCLHSSRKLVQQTNGPISRITL